MIRRLLSVCLRAGLLGVLIGSPYVAARPPDDHVEVKAFIATLTSSPPAPLFRLRPTARRTLAGSLLFGIHPALTLLPTDRILDSPCDHPQPADDDRMLHDMPKFVSATVAGFLGDEIVIEDVDWLKWVIRLSHLRYPIPEPEENEGYVSAINTSTDFAYLAANDPPNAETETTPPPTIEILPMPHEESDITCPYLRQQMIDRHACQIADPEIGRDVLANLECLKEADNLVELAKELARYGFLTEAMMCCDLAAKKCPGSPCAERAVDTMHELASGMVSPTTDTAESAESQPEESTEPLSQDAEPGVEPMVLDLMKACHLLMSQGMQHQAAELARQAFALDPQRVSADPLVYKMHLLAESPPTPAEASDESEPPTCPYCPSIGKPIREILPEKTKSKDGPTTFLVPALPPIDYEVVPALDGELHLSADCSLGENIYHLRYKHGSLTVWTTTDASKTNP